MPSFTLPTICWMYYYRLQINWVPLTTTKIKMHRKYKVATLARETVPWWWVAMYGRNMWKRNGWPEKLNCTRQRSIQTIIILIKTRPSEYVKSLIVAATKSQLLFVTINICILSAALFVQYFYYKLFSQTVVMAAIDLYQFVIHFLPHLCRYLSFSFRNPAMSIYDKLQQRIYEQPPQLTDCLLATGQYVFAQWHCPACPLLNMPATSLNSSAAFCPKYSNLWRSQRPRGLRLP
jgi:hypothetical protein